PRRCRPHPRCRTRRNPQNIHRRPPRFLRLPPPQPHPPDPPPITLPNTILSALQGSVIPTAAEGSLFAGAPRAALTEWDFHGCASLAGSSFAKVSLSFPFFPSLRFPRRETNPTCLATKPLLTTDYPLLTSFSNFSTRFHSLTEPALSPFTPFTLLALRNEGSREGPTPSILSTSATPLRIRASPFE